LVGCMEEGALPQRMNDAVLEAELAKIGATLARMADPDIFVWLGRKAGPTQEEVHRAATIVADRLCGSVANPIIRNAQEKRQLAAIQAWLTVRGYKPLPPKVKFDSMPPGTFVFRMNIPVKLEGSDSPINIPVDVVVKPMREDPRKLPLLIEAKSAGDFTTVNNPRKEQPIKINQLPR